MLFEPLFDLVAVERVDLGLRRDVLGRVNAHERPSHVALLLERVNDDDARVAAHVLDFDSPFVGGRRTLLDPVSDVRQAVQRSPGAGAHLGAAAFHLAASFLVALLCVLTKGTGDQHYCHQKHKGEA